MAILLLVLSIVPADVLAEDASDSDKYKGYDVVIMTDGSIVYGHIIRIAENNDVKIRDHRDIVIDIYHKKIAQVTTGDNYQRVQQQTQDAFVQDSLGGLPWDANYHIRLGIYSGDKRDFAFFSFVKGRRVEKNIFVGGGVGYHLGPSSTFVPIFVELDYNFLHRRPFPYVHASGGYSVAWHDYAEGGVGGYMFECGIGLRLAIVDGNLLTVQLNYRAQNINEEAFGIYTPWETGGLSVGFNF